MKIKDRLGFVPLLIFDGGHSENIYGASGNRFPVYGDKSYIDKYQFNQEVMTILMDKAKALGFKVFNVAPEDYDISLGRRSNRANNALVQYYNKYSDVSAEKLVLYVSIHYSPKDFIWGDTDEQMFIYYYPKDNSSKKLAELVNKELVKEIEDLKSIVKPGNYHVLRETVMPSILIDVGFKDLKKATSDWMLDKDFQEEMANYILQGCIKYFGIRNIRLMNPTIDQDNSVTINKLQLRIEQLEEKLGLFENNFNNKKN